MSEPTTAQVRTWAREQGLSVSDRGRLPAAVTEAYRTAHEQAAVPPAPPVPPLPPAPPVPAPVEPAPSGWARMGWTPGEPDPTPPGTNGWSVAALVTSLLGLGPVAVALGVKGLRQTRSTGQAGRGLAIAGVVVGALGTLWIALLVVLALTLDTPVQRTASGALVAPVELPLAQLRTGDCLTELPFDEPDDPVAVQPCAGLHAAEVFSAFQAPGTDYPGADALRALAETTCDTRFRQTTFVASDYEVLTIVPTRERWDEGDRRTHCLITGGGGTLTDSELLPTPPG